MKAFCKTVSAATVATLSFSGLASASGIDDSFREAAAEAAASQHWMAALGPVDMTKGLLTFAVAALLVLAVNLLLSGRSDRSKR